MVLQRYLILFSASLVALWSPCSTQAAFITTNEAGMDAVFSQAIFGGNPIDIVFNPAVTINTFSTGSLLDITTNSQLSELFGLSPAAFPGVNMYFVDTIDYCGGFNVSIVGCANTPGNDLVLESVFASGGSGTEVNSHELGHNLGLFHEVFVNLMSSSINGNTTLTAGQVTSILASPLVQGTAPNEFISITPVLITFEPISTGGGGVPEPGSFLLLLLGMVGLARVRRRR